VTRNSSEDKGGIQLKKLLAMGAVLALVGVIVAPMAAFAVDGTTTVSGVLALGAIEVTGPGAISIPSLYGTGDAVGTSGTSHGTVLCTSAGGYKLYISSDKGDGKMEDGAVPTPHKLLGALKVTPTLVTNTGATVGGGPLSGVVVTTTQQEVGSTGAGSPTEAGLNWIDLSVAQPKQITGDPGTYQIVLTFTATAN
jgi:hypothetical protein